MEAPLNPKTAMAPKSRKKAKKPAAPAKVEYREGLEGVVAARTALSKVDGENSRLLYRGYNIVDLARQASFEETTYLLWFGELPDDSQLTDFRAELARVRRLPERVVSILEMLPWETAPMAALRTCVSLLSLEATTEQDLTTELELAEGKKLLSQTGTILAKFDRLRRGKEFVYPREEGSYAAHFLYLLRGEDATQEEVAALDQYLVCSADHGLNASTFTARTIASTLSDIYSAVVGAIGALKGNLHGGAARRAMEMLLQIGDPKKARAYVLDALAQKKKIMGFGHRVYRGADPRSAILQETAGKLTRKDPRWYETACEVERVVQKEKGLHCNVDFYAAVVMYALGIPSDLFTPIFAMSRMAGWVAHVIEQHQNNRLIRPEADYIGEPERPFVPIENR